jgi:hypothetical protein
VKATSGQLPTRAVVAADAPGRERVEAVVTAHPVIREILSRAGGLGLPDWYLGGGAIAQAVWNAAHDFEPTHGIADYDLVYHDAINATEGAERAAEATVRELLNGLPAVIDVTNEARVHEWYPRRFGKVIPPYRSVEHAIATWPTTAASVGIRREPDGMLTIYAPFGLDDLVGLIVRPNRVMVSRDVYEAKVARWARTWPRLTIHPW